MKPKMESLLSNLKNPNGNQINSDDIFEFFQKMGYTEHEIAGCIGSARRNKILKINGKIRSKRIAKMVNVYTLL